jgi:hypothetical protein
LVNTLSVFFIWLSVPGIDIGFVFKVDGSSVFINQFVVVLFAPLAFVGFIFIFSSVIEEEQGA